MCIAIVKPYGEELPTKELLKTAWSNNPDGGGLMFNDGQNVYIHKGFTKFKGFYKFLKLLDKKVNLKERDLVIHFRIATSGGINRECTHPFPVSDSYDEMKRLDHVCKYGFAHNGIIFQYGDKTKFSDTMEYNKRVIYNIHDLENSEPLLDSLAYENASRFVVMSKDNFILGGDWSYNKENGCYFSNGSYKADYYTKTTTTVSSTSTDWYNKSFDIEDYQEKCDCCDKWCASSDLIDTEFGLICEDCFFELFGYTYDEYKDFGNDLIESVKEKDKEIIFE